jgi:hypothetical protein
MIQIKKRRGSLDMFSIAICDDEKAICAQLEQIFQEYMDRGIDTEVFFQLRGIVRFTGAGSAL